MWLDTLIKPSLALLLVAVTIIDGVIGCLSCDAGAPTGTPTMYPPPPYPR